MRYHYQTENTCAQVISFDLEENVVRGIEFLGGCSGNLKAISTLLEAIRWRRSKKSCWATPAADVPPPAPTSWPKPSVRPTTPPSRPKQEGYL